MSTDVAEMGHPPIESLTFAEPVVVNSPEEAKWYQSFTWPDGSETQGSWDYRGKEDDFLGRQDYAGKTVLELGPGSGFLTKEMEARGASVTCIDTADDEPWEAVPRKDRDLQAFLKQRQKRLAPLRASWWYSQRQFDGTARIAYAGVKALPSLQGTVRFDIGFISAVLQHFRHPVDVLYQMADLADTIVVTEQVFPRLERAGLAQFLPEPANDVFASWWLMPSTVVANVLATALFERVDHYTQTYQRGGNNADPRWPGGRPFYTSVFRRLHSER
jgi:O-methyltransferase